MRKILAVLFALSLFVCGSLTIIVDATSNEVEEYTEEYFKDKFKEVFPEYSVRIDECDTIAKHPASGISTYAEENEEITESITRCVEDDTYILTFFSDGGYSEVAILSETVTVDFEYGTDTGSSYVNCTVSTYLSDPGIITYTGGIIGDSISFTHSGSFTNYGSYINTGVDIAYTNDIAFYSRSASKVQVLGVAVGTLYAGDATQVIEQDTLLTITLSSSGVASVSFGYM